MIGRVSGRIVLRAADHVVIEAAGIGWLVQVSERTLAALPGEGEAAALWTELLVREDAMTLVGFATVEEKEWHRLLMTVQGVGAKAAMAILGTLGAPALGRALALGDWAAIKAAPGVGPKIAQRVVMELKDKAASVMAGPLVAPAELPARKKAAPSPQAGNPTADAMSALANLGYAPAEAAAAVARAQGEAPEAATPALIRAALKLLAPR